MTYRHELWEKAVKRTRISLYYLATYLTAGGLALLLILDQTLKFLLSNANYGETLTSYPSITQEK
jgi:hypothetical protein